jgi:hypothetical protein
MAQFVPEHATVLYEKSLRVRVQRADREDVTELLKVRLSLHQNTGSRAAVHLGAGDALSLLPQHERGTERASSVFLRLRMGQWQWIASHTSSRVATAFRRPKTPEVSTGAERRGVSTGEPASNMDGTILIFHHSMMLLQLLGLSTRPVAVGRAHASLHQRLTATELR